MTVDRLKSVFTRNWIFYLIGAVAIVAFKIYCIDADSGELDWVLAPTAWWVRLLSGIPFEKESHIGYISHQYRFIIAPSCSGVRFMTTAFAIFLYSFVHRMRTQRRGFCWLLLSLGASYLLTVFVNGIRIVISIFIRMPDFLDGWTTPETFHTLEGMVVYFVALLSAYQIADRVARRLSGANEAGEQGTGINNLMRKCIPPVLWYFALTLGIPLVRGTYNDEMGTFFEYAALMFAVCFAVVALFCIAFVLKKQIQKRHNILKPLENGPRKGT